MPSEHTHTFLRLKLKNKPVKDPDSIPKGYGLNSSATYYNLENAQSVKSYLDTLDPANKTKEILFPVDRFKSVNTVYQMLYQGWRFLIEHLDTPDRKYANLRAQMSLQKQKGRVRLYWNSRSCPTINGIPLELTGHTIEIEPNESVIGWKEVIMKWATESEEGSVEERKLTMTNDEVGWMRDYLEAFTDIVIVRINQSGYKLTKNAKLAQAIREERGG